MRVCDDVCPAFEIRKQCCSSNGIEWLNQAKMHKATLLESLPTTHLPHATNNWRNRSKTWARFTQQVLVNSISFSNAFCFTGKLGKAPPLFWSCCMRTGFFFNSTLKVKCHTAAIMSPHNLVTWCRRRSLLKLQFLPHVSAAFVNLFVNIEWLFNTTDSKSCS